MEEIRTEIMEEAAMGVAESVVEGGGLGLFTKAGIIVGAVALTGLTVFGITKFVKNKKNAKNEEEAVEDSVEESVEEAK